MERQFESFAGRVEIARQPDRCPARLSGSKRELPYSLDFSKVPEGNKDTVAIYSLASMSAPSNRGASDRNFFTYVVGKVSDSKSLIDKQHNINFSDL